MRILFLLIFLSFGLSAADDLKNIDLEKIENETKTAPQTEQVQTDTEVSELEIEDLEKIYFQYNQKLKNSKRKIRDR